MANIRPESPRLPSSTAGTSPNHHSLKQSLTASSYFRRARSERSKSPQKPRTGSPQEHVQHLEGGQLVGKSSNMPLNIEIPKIPPAAEAALTALKYLPTPLLVLSSFKTVILANEAMGRLLGLEPSDKPSGDPDGEESTTDEEAPNTDMLRGQSLSQLGIDMVQDGHQIWVSWEKFLDGLANDLHEKYRPLSAKPSEDKPSTNGEGHSTKREDGKASDNPSTTSQGPKRRSPTGKSKAIVHDIAVNVMISSQYHESGNISSGRSTKSTSSDAHVPAKMIISVWKLDNQRFFTLTFTSPYGTSIATPRQGHSRTSSRAQNLSPSTRSNPSSPGSPALCSHCGSVSSPAITTPSSQGTSLSPFPPMGPPGKVDTSAAPAILHKLSRMKDAIINAMDIPLIAMWKDESISIPNKAAAEIMYKKYDPTNEDAYDTLSRFKVYDEDFERELEPDELPIVNLCRTQQPFSGRKVGMLSANGQRTTWESSGKGIYDDKTKDFLGGIVALKDVTKYDKMLKTQHEENEKQFQLICETMPQMLWTTTPDGSHDWFSKRWYEYTGLTEEESSGEGWQIPFHPDDMPETGRRWVISLETGTEYTTEYRCRKHTGEWRWMLGRALPLRDASTGKIFKWFGSCTDIHDVVEARREAKETRQRLLNVIKHAKIAVWAIDTDRTLKFLEGRLLWEDEEYEDAAKQEVGRNIYEIFKDHHDRKDKNDMLLYRAAIERILNGEKKEQNVENYISKRKIWTKTRFIPVIGGNVDGTDSKDDEQITGVIGISVDVTEMKERDHEIQKQKKESLRSLSAESAAKEASKLKSQFLANMSHEIRTPIAGVIGMSELLLDTKLDRDQRECAENIQRSANGLLTVINDILDLSKVESGRLDIEEVQFSLGVVIKDVCKMLSFAAERKNLDFQSDLQISQENDLIVLGDPGRLRQILTNLLTNSIKFTTEGSVRLAVKKRKEDNDTVSVLFAIEDTGIGIEEDVRLRLFKPFSQADSSTARRFGGTGLGLTICKNLVELMHGHITLDSELGQGTKAEFCIPFHKPQFTDRGSASITMGSIPDRLQSELSVSNGTGTGTPPMSPMANDSPVVPSLPHERSGSENIISPSTTNEPETQVLDRSKTHVLVVEDNAINQQIAIRTVRKFGFSVNAVWNGQEALDYLTASFNSTHPKPDIILMDVQMPILDGYRATHQIRHHDPYSSMADLRDLPIIAMTASAIQGDREKCQKAGMDDYLAKPVKGKALESMLLKWVGHRKDDSRPTLRHHSTDDTNCAETDSNPLSRMTTAASRRNSASDMQSPQKVPRAGDKPRPSPLVHNAAAEPVPESTGDRATAAEIASTLRDDKLLAASEAHPSDHHITKPSPHSLPTPPAPPPAPAQLTVENIGRLDQEQGPAKPWNLLAPGLHPPHFPSAGGGQPGTEDPSPANSHIASRGSLDADHGCGDSSEMEREETVSSLRGPPVGSVERGVRGWLRRKESDRSQATTVRPDDMLRERSLSGEMFKVGDGGGSGLGAEAKDWKENEEPGK